MPATPNAATTPSAPHRRPGFTLIELLVVIAIIALLI
ncbi:MAG: prepilin-type N-terminal cleavage/methylation domain-containing protein, partial [Phycisphaerales bacterium]|nr:prepilin-type N-terminal cleavage/methylation domain-containing protein [Phycisphaerales bacterium]